MLWRVTLKAKFDNGSSWTHTFREIDETDSGRAINRARRIMKKHFPNTRVRTGLVVRDRKAEQRQEV